jgi:hypothetical protein
MDFPSGLTLAARAWARALPTLRVSAWFEDVGSSAASPRRTRSAERGGRVEDVDSRLVDLLWRLGGVVSVKLGDTLVVGR